jgi:predicted RNase H-like nuclease (RuvC/YqgF family)
MTDIATAPAPEAQEQSPTTAEPTIDVKAMQEEIERLRKHNETLLGEKKSVAQKAKEAEELARTSAEEKAKRDGDYETLLKAREDEKAELEKQFNEFKKTISDKELSIVSSRLGSKLAIDSDAAEVLEPFILGRIAYIDNAVVVLDDKGQPSSMSLDDLETEFRKTAKFKYLVAGSGASGGGASGTNKSSGTTKTTEALTKAKANGDVTSFLKHKLSGVM